MKFLLLKDLKKDQHFKPILSGLLLFILLYLISDFFVKGHSLGLTLSSLNDTLFGNEEEYLEPMEMSVFLESWHMEIFFMMMILLTLSAVFIRVSGGSKLHKIVIHTTLSSAFISLGSLAISYFYYPSLAPLYLAAFYLWHIGALYMVLTALKRLYVK